MQTSHIPLTETEPPIPPQNLEAESAVLGGILLENEALVRVLQTLTPEDFYRESHGKIFQAMIELWNRKEPIDLITLSDYLNGRGELGEIGGSSYLASLAGTIPTSANITYHARIVKETSGKRHMIEILRDGLEQAYSYHDTLSTITSGLLNNISPFQNGDRKGCVHISDVLKDSIKQIEQAFESKTPVGIPTGLTELEKRYGGFRRGDLVVIGGRTSMGKTSLATTMAKNAAQKGYPVAFVSAESTPAEIVKRMLSEASGIENIRLQNGILRDGDFRSLVAGAGRLEKLPIWFLGGTRSWDAIKAYLRGIKMREPELGLIVIDYCQLLSAPVSEKKRYLEVTKISSESKGLAQELDVAVLLLSQLSREPERQSEKRPKLSDLRESGSLEQDADLVYLLYWPFYYNKTVDHENLTELDVAKNRNGRTGVVDLRFEKETVSFSDWVEPSGESNFTEARERTLI